MLYKLSEIYLHREQNLTEGDLMDQSGFDMRLFIGKELQPINKFWD